MATNSPSLSLYESGNNRNRVIVNDSLIHSDSLRQSFLAVDIRLKRNVDIPKQSSQLVKTNILINGPIGNFNMFVKNHKHFPITGVLKTRGFISPQERNTLKVVIENPKTYDLR